MPLAGKMKQNHFFALLGLAALAMGACMIKCAQNDVSEPERNDETRPPTPPAQRSAG